MRIWDINPGYLNRQSLLGEHRELHGIVSITVHGKKGYARHPETLRWTDCGWALRQRHRLLAAEMTLRGYREKSPVEMHSHPGVWPSSYIDEPFSQFQILADKYQQKEQGRIPLPKNGQQLWSQHKYSVLARDVTLYKKLGREVSAMKSHHPFSEIARLLTELLRSPPSTGGLKNALQHMWGYVSDVQSLSKGEVELWTLPELLKEIQARATEIQSPYLMSSTALGELGAWIPDNQGPLI